MDQPAKRVYTFGDFRLDHASNLLIHKGQPVPLTPKVFDTLLLLVENSGRLVDKDQFMRRLWPDTFVGEDALAQNIHILRKVLEETANGQEYIATVPKRGYRFVPEVKEHTEPDSETSRLSPSDRRPALPRTSAVQQSQTAPVPAKERLRERWTSLRFAGVMAAVLVLLLSAGYAAWTRFRTPIQPSPNRRVMLAVLPFLNLSGDAGQDYFSDGLTEELITQLGRIDPQQLGVIARTSAMTYKGTQKNATQIGSELGVDYILEGSMRREASHVRISVQLIQAKNQTHIWAENYDRDLSDLLVLQSEVAGSIAAQIRVKLRPQKLAAGAGQRLSSPEATDAYFQGRAHWHKRSGDDLMQAVAYFNQAISVDQNFAPAYAGLADTYLLLPLYAGVPEGQAYAKARAAAKRALEMSPDSAEAQNSLAYADYMDWDFVDASKGFQRAISLDPNYATAHQWYAEYLANMGQFEEAVAEILRAQELDPLSPIVHWVTGHIYQGVRRYDDAIREYEKARAIDPFFYAWQNVHFVAQAYVRKGQCEKAVSEMRNAQEARTDPAFVQLTDRMAKACMAEGTRGYYRVELELLRKYGWRPGTFLAIDYAMLGEKDQAIASLEAAYERHDSDLLALRELPELNSLHSDPRYQDLVRRIGFPQ